IQFIFAPAPAAVERLLQPQLRFYYAGGIPAYATSDAFEPDPRANQDLDGLIFPDMPWMLGGPLAEAVHESRTPSSLDLSGLTGQLTLDPDGHVHRQLMWAQLHGGEVIALPSA